MATRGASWPSTAIIGPTVRRRAGSGVKIERVATEQRDDAEIIRVRPPGVVELLGGHAAGTGGPVLAVAIDRSIEIAGLRGGDVVELRSDRFPGTVRIGLDVDDAQVVEPDWSRLVAGLVVGLRPGVGIVGSISSTLPAGVGLASSSAFAVAVALALGAAAEDEVALARLAARAEQAGDDLAAGPEVAGRSSPDAGATPCWSRDLPST